MAEQPTVDKLYEKPDDKRNHQKLIAAVSYAPFGFVAAMLSGDQSAFVQKHMKQGTIVFVAYLIASALLPGGFITWLGLCVLVYAPVAYYYGSHAFQGETKLLPYIGDKL